MESRFTELRLRCMNLEPIKIYIFSISVGGNAEKKIKFHRKIRKYSSYGICRVFLANKRFTANPPLELNLFYQNPLKTLSSHPTFSDHFFILLWNIFQTKIWMRDLRKIFYRTKLFFLIRDTSGAENNFYLLTATNTDILMNQKPSRFCFFLFVNKLCSVRKFFHLILFFEYGNLSCVRTFKQAPKKKDIFFWTARARTPIPVVQKISLIY